MATTANGAGVLPQGVVPFPGQPQGQPIVPPGQTVMSHQPARGYSVEQLPPMPQQGQGQPQGTYGIPYGQPVQVQGGAQQAGWQPQPPQFQGMPQQAPPLFGQQVGPQHVLPWQQPQQGVPQAPGWPQPQPQQPSWPQQAQAGPQPPVQGMPQGLDPNSRLSGPGVPPELQGRTMGEALSMYNAMATNFRQQLPQRPQQQTQAPQQPTQSQPGAAPPKPQWLEPIAQMFEQQLDARLAPMQQFVQSQAVAQGYQIAKSMIPDLSVLETEMQQALTQAQDLSLFADPGQWKNLADFARGRMMAEGRYQYQPAVAPRQVQLPGQQNVQGGYGQQFIPSVPASYGATAPAHTWFTESPSAPMVGGMSGVPQQPTAQDVQSAANFQMPIGEWMVWKYGNAGQLGGMR